MGEQKAAGSSPSRRLTAWRVLALVVAALWTALIAAGLYAGSPSIQGVLFVAFFGVLSFTVIWFRRKCVRCGKTFLCFSSGRPQDVCPSCGRIRVTALHGLLAASLILAIVGFFGWYGGEVLARFGVPDVWARVLGVPVGVSALLALCCLNKEFRHAARSLPRLVLRQSERLDFGAARRAAGTPGRVMRRGRLTIWSDTGDDCLPHLTGAVEHAVEEFSRITGSRTRVECPLRILCFQCEAAFTAYTHGVCSDHGRMAGYYVGYLRKRVVLNREAADQPPSRLCDTIAHEVAHHLVRSRLGRTPRPWLSEGLAVLVASGMEGRLTAPGAGLRFLRAADLRGELLSGEQLLSLTYRGLGRRLKNWRNLEDATFCGIVYAQSASLLQFLIEEDADGFQRFLAAGAGKRRPERFFEQSFGLEPDDAMVRWRDHLLAAALPPHTEPPHVLKRRIESEFLATIRDAQAPPDNRRLAIGSLAAAGYSWWGDVLLETLDDADEQMRAEAQRALETVAGELRTERAAWRQWLDSVPVRPLK